MLTARSQKEDKTIGEETGADLHEWSFQLD